MSPYPSESRMCLYIVMFISFGVLLVHIQFTLLSAFNDVQGSTRYRPAAVPSGGDAELTAKSLRTRLTPRIIVRHYSTTRTTLPVTTETERQNWLVETNYEDFTDGDWERHVYTLAGQNLHAGKYIIMTIGNTGHIEFLLNWVAAMHKIGLKNFLIVSLDADLFKNLTAIGYGNVTTRAPSLWLKHGNLKDEAKWEGHHYSAVVQSKILIVEAMLKKNFTVVFSDDDVVWLSPTIMGYLDLVTEGYDFAAMVDDRRDFNTGFYLARPTYMILQVFAGVVKIFNKDATKIDQVAFNEVLVDGGLDYSRHVLRLDKLLFANGDRYIHRQWNRITNIKPLVLHANYLIGAEAKKNALKQAAAWFI